MVFDATSLLLGAIRVTCQCEIRLRLSLVLLLRQVALRRLVLRRPPRLRQDVLRQLRRQLCFADFKKLLLISAEVVT